MSWRPRIRLALAILAAAALVAVATSTRQRHPTPAVAAHYTEARGLRLRYVRAGHGATVVLVHGYGESLLSWRSVFDLLADRFDVIAIDLPGFGLSSKPATGYETDSLADDLLSALATLQVRRAVLIGHSLGGATVTAAALRDPHLVRALVLIDPALVGAPFAVPDAARSETAKAAARSAIAEYEALRTRFTSPHDPRWLGESDSALAYLPAGDPAYREALTAVLAQFDFGYLSAARARALAVPTLVMWGEYDPVLPIDAGRALAGALPDARFVMIERSWHRPHVERPQETAAAILRFLADLPPDSGGPNP